MSKFRTPNPGRFKRPVETKGPSVAFIAFILVGWVVSWFVGTAIGKVLYPVLKGLGFFAV